MASPALSSSKTDKIMPLILVGTAPVQILPPNPKRRKLVIQMQSDNVDPNNTGRVHIGYDAQPVAVVGHPNQGDILIQSTAIEEPVSNLPLDDKYKKGIWAVASAANQSIVYDEEVEAG
jgi:hypothetical protein